MKAMKKLKLDWGVWHAPFHQSWSEFWRQQCQLIGTNLASFPGHWPLTGRLIPVKPGKCRQEAHTGIRTMRQLLLSGQLSWELFCGYSAFSNICTHSGVLKVERKVTRIEWVTVRDTALCYGRRQPHQQRGTWPPSVKGAQLVKP